MVFYDSLVRQNEIFALAPFLLVAWKQQQGKQYLISIRLSCTTCIVTVSSK